MFLEIITFYSIYFFIRKILEKIYAFIILIKIDEKE